MIDRTPKISKDLFSGLALVIVASVVIAGFFYGITKARPGDATRITDNSTADKSKEKNFALLAPEIKDYSGGDSFVFVSHHPSNKDLYIVQREKDGIRFAVMNPGGLSLSSGNKVFLEEVKFWINDSEESFYLRIKAIEKNKGRDDYGNRHSKKR